jgi:hypothetical protein
LIQKARHLDTIIANAQHVTDFIDSIDPKRTLSAAKRVEEPVFEIFFKDADRDVRT